MHLTRVAVRHWRGLREFELAELDPGLNLVLGDNESGKSRLAQAIWYALFESSKGKAAHKLELMSWDGSGEPWVEVEVEAEGTRYRVEKTFGQGGCTTVLQGRGQLLRAEDAEQRLAELLRVGAPGGGRQVRDEELGVWPLLWIRQFTSFQPPHQDLNADSRARLQDLLSGAVGEVAAGPVGHELLERARAERARYYTDRGQERAPLKDAAAAVGGAQREVQEAERVRRQFEGAAAELGRLRQDLIRQAEDLARAESGLQGARDAAVEVGRVRAALEAQRGQVQLLAGRLQLARREAELRAERERHCVRNLAKAGRLEGEEAALLERRRAEQAGALDAARQAVRRAEADRKEAAAAVRRARAQRRRQEMDRRVAELRDRNARTREAAERAQHAAEQAGALRVSAEDVAELHRLAREMESTRARLAGVSTRVRLRAGRALTVAGEPLAAGEERTWTCDEVLRVAIVEVGELEVVPGGEELPALRASAERLAEGVKVALGELGVGSLEAAEERLRDRERLQRERGEAERLLAELCPEGTEALASALAAAVAERQALGPDEPEAPEEEIAEARLATQEAAEGERRVAVEVHQKALSEAESRLAVLADQVRELREAAAEQQLQLDAAPGLEALQEAVLRMEGEWQQALATAKGLEGRLAELGGDTVAAAVERLLRARDGLRAEAEQLGRRRTELETTLSVLAGQDVHEREQEAAARLAATEAELERIRRRAAAARKLADTLERCRTDSQTRLLAPAVAAVGRHLQPLFPTADITLGEDLSVVGLQTSSHAEALLDLSGGTREQVGLAVRLGLAELLADGERLPLVLDDALTNTDFRRIEQLHQVLFAAAERLQILIFSCHPEAFAGLGAARRYRLPGREPR